MATNSVSTGVLCTHEIGLTGNAKRYVGPDATIADLLEDAEMHGRAARAVLESVSRDILAGNIVDRDASAALWGAIHLFELTMDSVSLANTRNAAERANP